MLQRIWIVAMMIIVGAATDAGAQPAAGKPQQRGQVIKKLDADKDGQVSKSEFEAARSKAAARGKGKGKAVAARGKVFDRLDANGDGSLSATELKKLQELRSKKSSSRSGLPK